MLAVPLERGERALGVLSLLDRRDGGAYGPAAVERARLFAELAVSALGLEEVGGVSTRADAPKEPTGGA